MNSARNARPVEHVTYVRIRHALVCSRCRAMKAVPKRAGLDLWFEIVRTFRQEHRGCEQLDVGAAP